MNERIRIKEVDPAAYKPMLALESYVASVKDVSPLHKEMIRIRASQINGCAYCVNMHTADARKLGETEQRIYLMSVWRESPQFSEEERIILAMTEEITLIHKEGLTDNTYARAVDVFGPARTAAIIMMIITINAWNRIGVSTRMKPE
ncbi:carboxymuconolactone decarboxylase family protein [Dinghuibacter silviterrae]|uniref:AhpD family alkylhydroperoxidase n=1 Tax=Dinghuibacter silviterrae TaxID=1539049 RepID=A0A4R8DGL7_9BACT|nr:carboxymuconolactone decarboxylase family protein [Dinghuibacter silviterrae]TDW96819.1 AhpD family alkylhydroperoxidase [Dinghuibacter silviterrae]